MDFLAEVGSALRTHVTPIADRLVSHASTAMSGPTIPYPLADLTRKEKTWLAISAYNLGRAVERWPMWNHPAAAVVAVAPALATYGNQSGYKLHDIGLNPQEVLEQGQWHRLYKSTLTCATALQVVDAAAELYPSCARLEHRWGWRSMMGAVGAVSSLSYAFYLSATRLAKYVAPASALATQYTSAYAVGPSMVAIGMSVLAGYDQDVERSNNEVQVWGERYNWAGRLLVACVVVAPETGPSIEAHICGWAAGLACVYAVGRWAMPQWGVRAGLGWQDIGFQAGLEAIFVAATMAQRGAAGR